MVKATEPANGHDSTDIAERLHALLSNALDASRALGRPVLASVSELAPPVDPLDALENAISPTMYWRSPAPEGAEIAGIGTCVDLGATAGVEGRGDQRFRAIDTAWKALLETAVADARTARHTDGPILMGAFAFEPSPGGGRSRSAAWSGFGAASFVVPRLVVRTTPRQATIQFNALVDRDADVQALIRELLVARSRVVGAPVGALPAADARAPVADDSAGPAFRRLVQRALDAIHEGRLEKVVLASELEVELPGLDVFAAVRHLRARHPRAYVYAAWREDAVFLGASPELLVRRDGRAVSTVILAGSAPRGATPSSDSALGTALTRSAKDIEEHAIVLRDVEHALSSLCEDVRAGAADLVTHPNVQHLQTTVRARLREPASVFELLHRLHPTPAVGGAPRAEALRFIREHEGVDRGWYAGPIGWASRDASEFAVALRCALVRGDRSRLYAGCGIVAGSDPRAEWDESRLKLQTAADALAAGAASHAHADLAR